MTGFRKPGALAVIIRCATHKWWILGFILGTLATGILAWLCGRHAPDGLSGGTTLGLWTGLLATGCLAVVYVLPFLRRRALLLRKTGSRQGWMRAHIWLSALSFVFVLVHSGWFVRIWHFPGTLTSALAWVFLLTLLTGVLGLILQGLLPRALTQRGSDEVPLGQLAHLCETWRKEADRDVDQYCGPRNSPPAASADAATQQLRHFYEEQVRPFLQEGYPWRSVLLHPQKSTGEFAKLRRLQDLADGEKALLTTLETKCECRRLLAREQRLHRWLHVWLLAHVPPAWGLTVLLAAHVISALMY